MSEDENSSSNTATAQQPVKEKKPVPPQLAAHVFKPGDPRINRTGAPQSYHDLRRLILEKASEKIDVITGYTGRGKNKKPIVKKMTRAEALVIDQLESGDDKKQKTVLSYGFGEAPKHAEAMAIEKGDGVRQEFHVPADLFAPDMLATYRAVKSGKYREFVEYGGRGSTKSSAISLIIISLLINHPDVHGLVTRQVKDTIRDSVYAQMVWAINELGVSDEFHCTVSPMEITYIPTGQKVYFRGADDPGKIKSIKPEFGYIGILWLEELDQYNGPESVRKIEQSALRGGDLTWDFKSFNPPITTAAWVNKYIQIPKEGQWLHKSTYLTVPEEWLGQTFLLDAEHLKKVNPDAYRHEYLGEATGVGGQVFPNVKLRKITDAEIAQFDNQLDGLDFGFYPDPAHYGRCHYDAASLTLYLFVELRKYKHSNREMYDAIKAEAGYDDADTLICDSAEPKSVADYRAYGASAIGAEKGKDSVKYSIKWLQSLVAIVIDNERCPYSAIEFVDCQFEQTKDGEFINKIPDKNNHAIDETRYATNLIWRLRGQ
jgi:phage terminase large subunit